MIETSLGHFVITFKNNYKLSIFNGVGSYSENHFDMELFEKMFNNPSICDCAVSKDCEIAIIRDGRFVTSDFIETNDSVKGYVNIEELLDIINLIRKRDDKNE